METVRAKFECTNIVNNETERSVTMTPVISGSEENEKFFELTPGGELKLYWTNPEINFEGGKEYYLDITPAD